MTTWNRWHDIVALEGLTEAYAKAGVEPKNPTTMTLDELRRLLDNYPPFREPLVQPLTAFDFYYRVKNMYRHYYEMRWEEQYEQQAS